MPFTTHSRNFFALLLVLGAYLLMLTYFATTKSDDDFTHLFAETGFFESFSLILWLIAALMVPIRARPLRRDHAVFSLLFLFCALREADWHKKFTGGGIFKLKYYLQSVAPLSEKLLAALVALLFFGVLGYSLYLFYRQVRSARRWTESDHIILMGIIMFLITKVLDRCASILNKSFDIQVSPHTKRYLTAYEEGGEMLTPLFFIIALFWPGFREKEQPT
jgi:hypothetical protein